MFILRSLLQNARHAELLSTISQRQFCRKVANLCGSDSSELKKENVVRSQLKDFGKYVSECLPRFVQKVQLSHCGELEIMVAPEGILGTMQFLKDHHNCQFEVLVDITSIDVLSRLYRFELNYNILSLRYNSRVRVSKKNFAE